MGPSPTGKPTKNPKLECGNCGVRLPSSATRCHVCGAPARFEHLQRRCPNCGTPAARQARTCLMCTAPLGRPPTQRGLTSVPWLWIVTVVLIAGLGLMGWNYWRNQAQAPVAVAPSATPRATNTPIPVPTATALPTTPAPATSTPSPSPTPIIHEIQSGETVIYIASYYGTSPEAIMRANDLDETSVRLLRPGETLIIPSTGPVGGPAPVQGQLPRQVIHEVVSGETLISIALDFGTTVETIMDINELDSPDLIYEGQQLIVPLVPPTATLTVTPLPTASATPGPPFAAPDPLTPANDAEFRTEKAVILLSWTSTGILSDNQAYLVELYVPSQIAPISYTTQGTSWRLPSELWPRGRRETLSWRVTVVQRLNSDSDEPARWRALSPPSQRRYFVWR